MKIITTTLAAAALALFAGVSNAATYTDYELDTLLTSASQSEVGNSCDLYFADDDTCNGGGSNSDNEIAYLAEYLGLDFSDLDLFQKYEEPAVISLQNDNDPDNREYFFDIAPDQVGWFILKFGAGQSDGGISHFFFENIGELSKLVWNDFQTNDLLNGCNNFEGSGGLYSSEIGSCTLSHITTVVPVPAAGWLLLGGLGGLAALRRRKTG